MLSRLQNIEKGLKFSINNSVNSYKRNFENICKLLKAPNLILKNFDQKLNYIFQNLEKNVEEKNNSTKKHLIQVCKTLKIPDNLLFLKKNTLLNLSKNLNKIFYDNFNFKKENFQKIIRLLNANSVTTNLKKGYSILTKKNKLVKNSKFLKPKDNLKVQLINDILKVEVKKIN